MVCERYGIGHSTVAQALHILKYGLPEDIIAIRCGKVSVHVMFGTLRDRSLDARSAEIIQFRQTSHHNGPSIPGMTLRALAQQAMEMRKQLPSVRAVATQLGIGVRGCSQLIDIALVAARNDLTGRDAEIVADVLRQLDSDTGVVEVLHARIRPIRLRLWGQRRGGGGERMEMEAVRQARFDSALGVLTQACANSARMEVPHLAPRAASQVTNDLRDAVKSVRALIDRVEAIHS
jgi:hypothetical protein